MDYPTVHPICPLDFRDPLHRKEVVLAHAWAAAVGDTTYTAPQWLMSDGASIPRILWRLCPPLFELHRPGAVLHDAAYKGVLLAGDAECSARDVGKKEADTLLLYLCVFNGMPKWKAKAIYWGVHRFGGIAWRKEHKKYQNLDRTKLSYSVPSGLPDTCNLLDMATGETPGYLLEHTC